MGHRITDLLFQARILKELPRSGYHFLGAGQESVAEHIFMTAFIAFVMAQLEPEANGQRLVNMCLVHDLTEARVGDLNMVHKNYVSTDHRSALDDTASGLPFGDLMAELIDEFEAGRSLEAQLARDADQLSLILDLKALADIGYRPPDKWLPNVVERLQTDSR